MKVPTCKCCGHPIVSNGVDAVLTPLQRRNFNIVKRAGVAGIGREDILQMVYADDPDGGPDSHNIISVVVNHANRRLKKFSLKIHGRRGHGGFYTIEALTRDGQVGVAA